MLGHILKKISEEKSIREIACYGGVAKDFAEYRYLCGVIQGLRRARMEVQDLVQRYEDYDND